MLKQLTGFSLEEICQTETNEKFRNAPLFERYEMMRPMTAEESFDRFYIGYYGYDKWKKFQYIKWLMKEE